MFDLTKKNDRFLDLMLNRIQVCLMKGLQFIQKHSILKNIENINKFVIRIIIKSLKDTFLEDKVCSVLHPDEVKKGCITGGCVLHKK